MGAVPVVTLMLAALRFARGASGGTSRKLRAKRGAADVRCAADQKRQGCGADSGAIIVQPDACGERSGLAFAETRVGAGGTGEQTIETGLDAVFDALRRLLRMAPQHVQTMVHEKKSFV
jgi:hypothetical protein